MYSISACESTAHAFAICGSRKCFQLQKGGQEVRTRLLGISILCLSDAQCHAAAALVEPC